MLCAPNLQRVTRFQVSFSNETWQGIGLQVVDLPLPNVSQPAATQPTPKRDIPWPGSKVEYDPLVLKFLATEGLANYKKIFNWLKGNAAQDVVDTITAIGFGASDEHVFSVQFLEAFPTNLTSEPFTTQDSSDSVVSFTGTFEFSDMIIT